MYKNAGTMTVFLAVFCMLYLLDESHWLSTMSSSSSRANEINSYLRHEQSGTNHAGAGAGADEASSECPIAEPKVSKHKVESTFLASYPGSGSRLSWQLISALTGMITTNDVFSNGQRNAVAIKTHYPCPEGKDFTESQQIHRAIIFIRHPMDAITAYHDLVYAISHNLSHGKTHAPVDDWTRWRDGNFAIQIQTWRKHLEFWMDRYSSSNRVIVPYEHIIDPNKGVIIAEGITEFLSRGEGVTTVPPEDIPCILETVVRTSMEDNGMRRRRRLISTHTDMKYSHDNKEHSTHSSAPLSLRASTVQSRSYTGSFHRRLMEVQEDPPQTPIVPNTNRMGTVRHINIISRPYLKDQMREVIIALTQLLEKYRSDKLLAPIIVEYIDQVTA